MARPKRVHGNKDPRTSGAGSVVRKGDPHGPRSGETDRGQREADPVPGLPALLERRRLLELLRPSVSRLQCTNRLGDD